MAERKLVALTFDDGPTLGITAQGIGGIGGKQRSSELFPDWSEYHGADRVSGEACL